MSLGLRTPGPIHHFVRFRGYSTAYYLGTAVAAPEQEQEKFKLEVMNDLGGRSVPFQLVQDGEKWYVYTTLNRFDYSVCMAIRALENGIAPISVPPTDINLGTENGIARGTLTLGISDFQLILVNQYFGTVAAGSFAGPPDLAAGRGFSSCNLRKYKESTIGTRVLEVAMAIECLGVFNLSTRGFDNYSEAYFGSLAVII